MKKLSDSLKKIIKIGLFIMIGGIAAITARQYALYEKSYYDNFYHICNDSVDNLPSNVYDKSTNKINVISPFDGEIKEVGLNYVCTEKGENLLVKQGYLPLTENNIIKTSRAPNICEGKIIISTSDSIETFYKDQRQVNCYYLERNLNVFMQENTNFYVLTNNKMSNQIEILSLDYFISVSNDFDFKSKYDVLQNPLPPPPQLHPIYVPEKL